MGGARYAARSKPESGVLGGETKWACAEGVVVGRVREDGGLSVVSGPWRAGPGACPAVLRRPDHLGKTGQGLLEGRS